MEIHARLKNNSQESRSSWEVWHDESEEFARFLTPLVLHEAKNRSYFFLNQ